MNYKGIFKKLCEEDGSVDSYSGDVYKDQLNFREIIINDDIKDNLIEKAVIPIINFNRFDESMELKIKDYVRDPIRILINSSGGVIDSCMSLVSTIKSSKTPVHTICLGKAYSAGFLILISGHQRFIQEYGKAMIHPGSGGYVGSFPSILKHADEIHELQERINQYVIDHTFLEKEELDEMVQHELDWYMYAEEALCRGVVDGIIVGGDILSLDDYVEQMKKIEKERKEAESVEKPVKKKPAAKKTTKPKTTKEK